MGEGDAVSLERGRRRAGGPQVLALERQRRNALLKSVDAEPPPFTCETAACYGPQSRSTHLECLIGKRTQTLSPQTGHFAHCRKRVG